MMAGILMKVLRNGNLCQFLQICPKCQNAVADRIELFSELAVWGVTHYGMLKQVLSKLSIPIYVLIRPRSGDFCYSEDDFEIIVKEMEGVTFGFPVNPVLQI